MIKKLSYLTAMLLVMGLFVSSCGDDGDGEPSTKTNAEYLTSGTWITTAMTIDPGVSFGGATVTDFFAQIPACSKDDLMTFNSNGSLTEDEGPTKCYPNDPQTTTDGTWALSADSKVVTIDYPDDDPFSITIVSIDDSSFVGTYELVEDFGAGLITYVITVSMGKN